MRNRLGLTSLIVLAFALLVGAALAGPRSAARKKAVPQKKAASKERVFRTSAPPVGARLGDVWVNPIDNGKMVYVPAGEFSIGDAEDAPRPQFRAYLKGYWIDKHEVTVAQYRKFCRATEMPLAPPWGWHGNHPMVNVDWDDAAAYARWAGERLPTELEWEKAARGADGRIYPWGNQWDPGKCAHNERSTEPVGCHPAGASPYGAMDMVGNAWEWCADWYDEEAYKQYAQGDLTPPTSGTYRVLRGGTSWFPGGWTLVGPTAKLSPNSWAFSCRCTDRQGGNPDRRSDDNGFRCVRGPS